MTKHHDPKELRLHEKEKLEQEAFLHHEMPRNKEYFLHQKIMNGADEEDHLHSHWYKYKHFYGVVLSIFMTILMVSFTFAAFPVGDILAGLAASSLLGSSNNVEFEGGEMILSSEVADALADIYIGEEGAEISVCLEGEIVSGEKGLEYRIDSYYFPQIFHRSFAHVRFESCGEDTIVSLHTHPRGRCIPSDTDWNTLRSWQQNGREDMHRNEDISGTKKVIMAIQCGNRRFTVIS